MELTVATDIPSGNAVTLETRLSGRVPEVHFTPSPAGGPEAMWFCFEVRSTGAPPDDIRCVLHFVDNLLGGGPGKPVLPVFATERRDWARVEAVTESETPDGRTLLSWTVPGREGAARTALCYPYGMAELDGLSRDVASSFETGAVGVTTGGRVLPRLSNGPGQAGSERPGVYCLARQHAAEATGSWMLDGFLRAMAEAGGAAPLVWAAPFANLDGVCAGHYGKDSFPWDFNRAWGSKMFPEELRGDMGTHPMRYEIKCLQTDMARWRTRCKPVLVLDFHAPGLGEGDGIYCFLRDVDAEGRPDALHQPWVESFEQALGRELAAERFARSGRYPSRWNTARLGDFANKALQVAEVTFEIPYGRASKGPLTREDYREAGRRVAQAVIRRLAEAPR